MLQIITKHGYNRVIIWFSLKPILIVKYLPYKFRLLLRGSRNGFTPKAFHTICENEDYTITF